MSHLRGIIDANPVLEVVALVGLVIALSVVLAAVLAAWAIHVRLVIRQRHERDLKATREDSTKRQGSVLKGQISEQMAPLFPEFRYASADARFLGKPVDFIVFDGYSAAKDGAELKQVVFVEVKTGGSDLSTGERRVRDCIQEGRVSWELVTLNDPD